MSDRSDATSPQGEELVALLEGPPPDRLPDSCRAVPLEGCTAIAAPSPERSPPRGLQARGPRAIRRMVAEAALVRQRRLEGLPTDRAMLPCAPRTPVPTRPGDLAIANADILASGFGRVRGRQQYQIVVTATEPGIARDGLAPAVQRAAALALLPLADDTISHPVDADTLLNVTLLMDGARAPHLDGALEQIDAIRPDGLRVRLIGPGPAVSFALARLTLVPLTACRAAAAMLGATDDAPPALESLRGLRRAALKRAGMPDRTGRHDGPAPSDIEAAVALLGAMARIAAVHGGMVPAEVVQVPVLDISREAPASTTAVAPARARVA